MAGLLARRELERAAERIATDLRPRDDCSLIRVYALREAPEGYALVEFSFVTGIGKKGKAKTEYLKLALQISGRSRRLQLLPGHAWTYSPEPLSEVSLRAGSPVVWSEAATLLLQERRQLQAGSRA